MGEFGSASKQAETIIHAMPISDTTAPGLLSAVTNDIGTEIWLDYNESLARETAADSDFEVTVNGTQVKVTSVTTSGSRVILALEATISAKKGVSLRYTDPSNNNDGNAIQDTADNDAASISDPITVENKSDKNDTIAPKILSAKADTNGRTISLLCTELLATATADPKDFKVKVAGTEVDVRSVKTDRESVILQLEATISEDQPVSVTYTDPSGDENSKAIQDITGNDAATQTIDLPTTNGSTINDKSPPGYESAATNGDGTQIELTYGEALSAITADGSNFDVSIAGTKVAVKSVTTSGKIAFLALAGQISTGQAISMAYNAPTSGKYNKAIQDIAGNNAGSLPSKTVTNKSGYDDEGAPAFVKAETNGNGTQIELTYGEALSVTTAEGTSFDVSIAGTKVAVTSVTTSGEKALLALAGQISTGQVISVAYNAPTSGKYNKAIQDIAGNNAGSLPSKTVANKSGYDDKSAPGFVSAATSTDGATIVLTYGETLSAKTAAPSDFYVTVAGNRMTVDKVETLENTVILSLHERISTGKSVTVAYTHPGTGNQPYAIQDLASNAAASQPTTSVTNRSNDAGNFSNGGSSATGGNGGSSSSGGGSSSSGGGSSNSGNGGSSTGGGSSSEGGSATSKDPAPAAKNFQPSDSDNDGIIEVTIAPDGKVVDANGDGIGDAAQSDITALRLINDGARASDYGALRLNAGISFRGLTLTEPKGDGTLTIAACNSDTVVTTMPYGIANAFAGIITLNAAGVTLGGSTQATIKLPAGLPASSGYAYLHFNCATDRLEEYTDAAGNPLYSLNDSDGNGVVDSLTLTLLDGVANWDGDGKANGTVLHSGFLAAGHRSITGSKRRDALTGNVLRNTIKGKKGNDTLLGRLGNDILKGMAGNDSIDGGEGADQITGGAGKNSFIYNTAADSPTARRDSVKVGKTDRFVFTSFDGASTSEGQQKLTFIGNQAFSGLAGELRAAPSVLEADLNGDGFAEFAINLRGNTQISKSQLVL